MYKNEIKLPLHTSLNDKDVEYVINTFKNALNEVMTSNVQVGVENV